jgi:DNA replication protein DnaC
MVTLRTTWARVRSTPPQLVHELLEARDEKLRLQRQLAGYKLLIIDELGYVPLSRPAISSSTSTPRRWK